QGRTDQACLLLEQALQTYERLDAARDLARAEAVLRKAGIRPGPRGPRGRPQSGWPRLTPAQHAVARPGPDRPTHPQIRPPPSRPPPRPLPGGPAHPPPPPVHPTPPPPPPPRRPPRPPPPRP